MDQQSINIAAIALQAGVPIIWWSSPGGGKTVTAGILARDCLHRPFRPIRASLYQPEDHAGYPVPNADKTFVNMVPNQTLWGGLEPNHVVFLDELTTCEPAKQAALLGPPLERRAGSFEIPPGVSFIAASNPPNEAAGGHDLSPATANRWLHRTLKKDAMQWVRGTLTGWPTPTVPLLPVGWEALIPTVGSIITA